MTDNLMTITWAEPWREIRITTSKQFVVGTALSFSGRGGDEYRTDKTPSFVLAKALREGAGISEVTVKPSEATLLLEPGTIWYFIRQPIIELLLQELGWTATDSLVDDQATAEEVTLLGLQIRIQRGPDTMVCIHPSVFVSPMVSRVHGGIVQRIATGAERRTRSRNIPITSRVEGRGYEPDGSMPPSGYCD